MGSSGLGRVRVERGIYRQPNGKYAVCWRHAGRLHFRTVTFDVAGWRLDRSDVKVAARERHPRTLEAHRYQLGRHLLRLLGEGSGRAGGRRRFRRCPPAREYREHDEADADEHHHDPDEDRE